MFFGNLRIFFKKLVGWTVNKMERINTKKEHNHHSSVFKVLRWLSYYLIVTGLLIIFLIFILKIF